MDFSEAESRYAQLEHLYHQGNLSEERYQQELSKLTVIDSTGYTWMLQAHSGQWYVYRQQGWAPAHPPGRQQPDPVHKPASSPAQPKKLIPTLLIAGGSISAICVLLAGVVFLVLRMRPAGQPLTSGLLPAQTEEVTETPALTLVVQNAQAVLPGSSSAPDAFGVSLTVPVESVAAGDQVQLTTSELQGGYREMLEKAFSLDTPVYQVAAAGESDGALPAELILPAGSPDSRVMVIIDETYLGVLDVLPENGQINVKTNLGPSIWKEGSADAGLGDGSGSLHYAVVTPREDVGWYGQGAQQLAARSAPDVGVAYGLRNTEHKNCLRDVDWRGRILTYCRTNAAGTIQVRWAPGLGVTDAHADQVITSLEAVTGKFKDAGFQKAELSAADPMYVVITKGESEPTYKPVNGVIYLPVDTAKNAAGMENNREIWHETAHWVQDKTYYMIPAYWDSAGRWWIEVSAENMIMLFTPSYLRANLITYGGTDNTFSPARTGFQFAPFQWNDALYIHAQLLKVYLCDNGAVCPLSEKTFIENINKGYFPFNDSAKQDLLRNNLDDYAHYLLGGTPKSANSGVQGPAQVSLNEIYGEGLFVAESRQRAFSVSKTGFEPQMKIITGDAMKLEAALIDVQIEKGGVYPLYIANGSAEGGSPGLPAMLKIDPGAPYWMRIGDGEAKYYDGSAEVIVQPIHSKMGVPTVRLVVLGKTEGAHFSAMVSTMDLQGDWIFTTQEIISHELTCSPESESLQPNQDWTPSDFLKSYSTIMAAKGAYTFDPLNNRLVYQSDGGEMLDINQDGYHMNFQSDAALSGEEIQVHFRVHMEPTSESSSIPDLTAANLSKRPGVPVLPLALLPVAGFVTWRNRKRGLAITLILAVLALSNLACVLVSLDTDSQLRFNKIENLQPIGQPPAPDIALLRLSGEPQIVNLEIVIDVPENFDPLGSLDGEEEFEEAVEFVRTTCTALVKARVTVDIFPDGVITTPSSLD